MNCPQCGAHTEVKDTRVKTDHVVRRRLCFNMHTFQTKDVRGISLGMYSVFTVGVALWLAYGVLMAAWPIVLANSITLTLAILILTMKLRYR